MLINKSSAQNLSRAHPLLQKLFNEVASRIDIGILDSTRGRAAQELAFRKGNTKVRFGKSAHNYVPAIALDVYPAPLNWKSTKPFIRLGQKFVLPLAREMKIPIRWGADWDMDSDLSDEDFVDMPHYELHPWRSYAAKAKLFEG